MKRKENLQSDALELTPLEDLATNCPRCFGPRLPCYKENGLDISNLNEPEFVVAFAGNFQHGRHQPASHELEEINVSYPSTFMEPKEIDKWKPQEEGNGTNDEPVCIHWSARLNCDD